MNLEKMRSSLRAQGFDPYALGLEGDPQGSIDAGFLLRSLPGGRVQVLTRERARTWPIAELDSMSEAFDYVVARLRTEPDYIGSPSPGAESVVRMQEYAERVKKRFDERAAGAVGDADG